MFSCWWLTQLEVRGWGILKTWFDSGSKRWGQEYPSLHFSTLHSLWWLHFQTSSLYLWQRWLPGISGLDHPQSLQSQESDSFLVAQVSLKYLIDLSSVMCLFQSSCYDWSNSENGWSGLVQGLTLKSWEEANFTRTHGSRRMGVKGNTKHRKTCPLYCSETWLWWAQKREIWRPHWLM